MQKAFFIGACLTLGCTLWSLTTSAQQAATVPDSLPAVKKDTVPAVKQTKDRRISLSGMLIGRYTTSFNKDVDVNGRQSTETESVTTRSFSLRRARLLARAQITDKAEATVLFNLTDFTGNPQNKVLETVCLRYQFNDYLKVQVGQFRPYFGKEDLYPEELLQTLEWSNQYYAFGANGWQSFQAGATLYGEIKKGKLPIKYYAGVFNGNGRNQLSDNDNGKLFPARIEMALRPQTKLGLNAGVGKDRNQKVWAVNADIDHTIKLGKAWSLQVQSEYKRGINNALFFNTTKEGPASIDSYQVEGLYVLPNLKYTLNKEQIKSLEFSLRCETLDTDVKREGNRRNTIVPMLSAHFAENNFLVARLGMIMDRYRYDVPNTSQYSSKRMMVQLLARF
jgi:phosphate-selective porin